jgi:hypothetical protein
MTQDMAFERTIQRELMECVPYPLKLWLLSFLQSVEGG